VVNGHRPRQQNLTARLSKAARTLTVQNEQQERQLLRFSCSNIRKSNLTPHSFPITES